MKQWKVKFMRKGSEPPYPFGKSERIVLAETKAAAIDVVRADGIVSPRFKITASACPSNVTGQRTRHLVAGTLDPLVGLLFSFT